MIEDKKADVTTYRAIIFIDDGELRVDGPGTRWMVPNRCECLFFTPEPGRDALVVCSPLSAEHAARVAREMHELWLEGQLDVVP